MLMKLTPGLEVRSREAEFRQIWLSSGKRLRFADSFLSDAIVVEWTRTFRQLRVVTDLTCDVGYTPLAIWKAKKPIENRKSKSNFTILCRKLTMLKG